MTHLLIFYYILLLFVGAFALIISIIGTIRSKVANYWLLVAFQVGFTGLICVLFVQQYIYLNIETQSLHFVLTIQKISSVLTVGLIASITIYFQQLFITRHKHILDAIIVLIGLINMALIVFFNGLSISGDMLILNTTILISIVINLCQFFYLLLLGGLGSKKDRALKELILIWSVIAFVSIGFLENIYAVLIHLGNDSVAVKYVLGDFLFATFPFVFFCAVLIYYFSHYVLAIRNLVKQDDHTAFYEQYGISTREKDVLVLLNIGLSNKEIAEKLNISVATVKTHIRHIYEKTDVNNRYKLFHLTMNSQ